jgi:uncharacterized protein YfbU (UPF0304 family)
LLRSLREVAVCSDEEGLSVTFSRIERLLLFNQYRILERLDPDGADTYRKNQDTLAHGYELEYSDILRNVYDPPLSEEACSEAIDVLAMFEAIGRSGAGDEDGGTFSGYDGNAEPEFSYIQHVRRDGRFEHVIDPERFNSHAPMRAVYRRMLAKWRELGDPREMTREQAQQVIKARAVPR